MRKLASLLTVIFSTSIILSSVSFSAATINVVVNGDRIAFPDAKPFVDAQERTQTPARFIGEALGATASWDGKTKKATFEKGSKKLVFSIGKDEYEVDGQKRKMDTVAIVDNSRTYVPARYVAEAFGATVRWENTIKTVYIELKAEPTSTSEKVVGGFKVPADTNVSVVKLRLKDYVEAAFMINFLKADLEKQKADFKGMLLQKFESDVVEEIIAHINQKKDRFDELPEKYFYSKKNNQYIWIEKSVFADISILIYVKGYKR